ncbi:MAG: phosphate propanoyltransferase [Bacillota bacterium]|nr:phosphate propanoyltransferase [Bacillota bacterium]
MENKIIVETSARHIHVSEKDFYKLFGENAKLTNKKDLSQPGQFACEEKVTVVGPKGQLTMSILGPYRKDTQVEMSLTDTFKIGVKAPIRESGDVSGTPGCKLIGPAGECEIECGIIVAKRHIHLDPPTAEKFGINDQQIVKVAVGAEGRKIIFDDVVARVNASYAPAVHIDTDEANAAGLSGTVEGIVIS